MPCQSTGCFGQFTSTHAGETPLWAGLVFIPKLYLTPAVPLYRRKLSFLRGKVVFCIAALLGATSKRNLSCGKHALLPHGDQLAGWPGHIQERGVCGFDFDSAWRLAGGVGFAILKALA